MSKSDYKVYFAMMKPKIKFSYFLDLCGIDKSKFSKFMTKNTDWELSIEKLELLYNCIKSELKNV